MFGSGKLVFLQHTLVSFGSAYRGPNILLLFQGAFLLFGLIVAGSRALNKRLMARKEAV